MRHEPAGDPFDGGIPLRPVGERQHVSKRRRRRRQFLGNLLFLPGQPLFPAFGVLPPVRASLAHELDGAVENDGLRRDSLFVFPPGIRTARKSSAGPAGAGLRFFRLRHVLLPEHRLAGYDGPVPLAPSFPVVPGKKPENPALYPGVFRDAGSQLLLKLHGGDFPAAGVRPLPVFLRLPAAKGRPDFAFGLRGCIVPADDGGDLAPLSAGGPHFRPGRRAVPEPVGGFLKRGDFYYPARNYDLRPAFCGFAVSSEKRAENRGVYRRGLDVPAVFHRHDGAAHQQNVAHRQLPGVPGAVRVHGGIAFAVSGLADPPFRRA